VSEIFISHVEEDEGIALDIARELEAAGYRTWYYERDADPGLSYLVQIHHAIERCSAIVIVITPAAVRSHQMTVEVVRGHESGKAFLPVRSGISHAEFQQNQQEWGMALGAAASLTIPPEGAVAVVPRLIRGLQGLGIEPTTGARVEDRRGRDARSEGDPGQAARREEEQRRRDAEFAELGQRLDGQRDRADYSGAMATAEAMLRLRPGDGKALSARAFVSERLARSAERRTAFDVVRSWTKSKPRVAAAAAGGAILLFLAIGIMNQRPSAPPVPPVPESAPQNVEKSPRTAWVEAPYRNIDVIGRRPAVVQVFDPT
jgi:TIR domain-containing protein